ncbi:hypothetical protein L596_025965 [Steinernema carpocapsae]|uniref:Uncharacterized protein n=1 Tax=Steinernema carpocapsae TaxID=34508 RepID=A0A4U5M9D0_STECR|nr:hypothetical protein L596_025965 [Steinernema carpocapsae]
MLGEFQPRLWPNSRGPYSRPAQKAKDLRDHVHSALPTNGNGASLRQFFRWRKQECNKGTMFPASSPSATAIIHPDRYVGGACQPDPSFMGGPIRRYSTCAKSRQECESSCRDVKPATQLCVDRDVQAKPNSYAKSRNCVDKRCKRSIKQPYQKRSNFTFSPRSVLSSRELSSKPGQNRPHGGSLQKKWFVKPLVVDRMDQWTLVQLKGGDVAADRSSHGPTNFRILKLCTGNSRGPTSEVFVPSKDLLKKQTDSRSYAKVLQSRKSSSDSNGFNAALTGQRSTVLSQSRVVPQVLDRFDGRITGGNDVTRPAMKQVAKPAIPKSGENAVVFGRSSRRSNLNAVSFNRKSPSDKALGGSSCAGRATLCGGGQLAESIKRDVSLSLDLCNSVTRRRSHSPVSEIEVDDAERLLVVPVPFPDLIHCPKCHFKSYKGATNVESMLRHLLRDHGIEGVQAKFLCRWCNFSPAERYKYPLKVVRAHVVQEHPSMKLEEADLPLPHSCPNCRVSYPTYQGLSNHTRKCKSMKGLCETPKTSKPQGSTQNRANNVVGKPVQQIEVPRTTEKAIELMVIDLSDSDSEPRVANKAELRKAELARLRCLTLFNGEGAWLSCGVIREYLDMRLPKHLCVDAAVLTAANTRTFAHMGQYYDKP